MGQIINIQHRNTHSMSIGKEKRAVKRLLIRTAARFTKKITCYGLENNRRSISRP